MASLLAPRIAGTGRYDAFAATAFVADGGIYRHEFVAQAVVSGLMDVQIKTEVPVLSISLTPHNVQPTDDHIAFVASHFIIKVREAASAVARPIKAKG